jgi:hypothetical protein
MGWPSTQFRVERAVRHEFSDRGPAFELWIDADERIGPESVVATCAPMPDAPFAFERLRTAGETLEMSSIWKPIIQSAQA